uniref:Uncharacterized protein n=1 Tax=Arundo donax TaxID=35708 RepID=A0A0A9A6S3_ARUDO
MEEKCASDVICFASFLPAILASKIGGNEYLELLLSTTEKLKESPYTQVLAELIIWNFPETFSSCH